MFETPTEERSGHYRRSVCQPIKDYKKPEDLIGENGLLKQLTKRLLEKAIKAEITDHLVCAKNAPAGNNTGYSCNGSYKKKVKGDFGEIDLTASRDRNGTIEPALFPMENAALRALTT